VSERLEAIVRGRVQGVGFRWFVVRDAERLGLTGWVANESDGSVRVVAEGSRTDLDHLAERLTVGPSGAHVIDVDLHWSEALGAERGFTVRARGHSGD
jgi:acylphosphatase